MKNDGKKIKSTSTKLWMAMLSLLLLQSQVSWAQDKVSSTPKASEAGSPQESNSDKLDVSNLEQKYWSAKDDEYTVVQNRTYTKNRRFFVNLSTGRLINDGFVEGVPNSFGFGYFFNEKNGISLDYTQFTTKDNQTTDFFFSTKGSKPNYNSPVSTTSLSYIWSPIYAKVSLLEKRILYLDLSVALRLGQTKYNINLSEGALAKQATHYGIDVSQLWFLNKRFAFRFDIRNSWSKQELQKFYQSIDSTRDLGSDQLQDTTWMFGLNIFFGR